MESPLIETKTTMYGINAKTGEIWTTFMEIPAEFVTLDYFNNTIAAIEFFRSLGGVEVVTEYDDKFGIKTVKLISENPDRTKRVVREFKFYFEEDIENGN